MNRHGLLFICLLLPFPVGCNTLFNPDQAISAALASYAGDVKPAAENTLRQGETAIEDRSASERLTTKVDRESFLPLNEIPADVSLVEPRDLVNTSQELTFGKESDSSWERIEKQMQQSSQAPAAPSGQLGVGSSLTISDSGPTEVKPSVENNQQTPSQVKPPNVIKIHDVQREANSQSEPVLPLIQRPLIYGDSVVQTPLERELKVNEQILAKSNEVERSGISWKDSLEATIAHLQGELSSQQVGSDEARRLQKCLKILRSVAGNPSAVNLYDKLGELNSTLPNHQFEALQRIIEQTDDRKSNLISQLRAAVQQVSQSARLIIENAKLCTAVTGFGKFKQFESYRFRPGDEVLLYCELQNLSESRKESENEQLVRTCQLDAQVEFLDEQDQIDYVKSFANIKDECKTERKDFYVFFRFKIPNLSAGKHKVQIRFTDKIGRKTASLATPLEFEVLD